MVGGAIGAYLLTTIPGDTVAPFINAYLLLMGAWILWKAFRAAPDLAEPPRWLVPLGLGGGFLDAIGGGGWGPMVTSTLLGHGTTPRFTIGSVNFTEFFVTATISVDLPRHHRPRAVADHRRPDPGRRPGGAGRGLRRLQASPTGR